MPHEEIVPKRVLEVMELIISEQNWTQPICIERNTHCIMDGHHRYAAALRFGLLCVPVVEFGYDEVLLGSWRTGVSFDPVRVIERALNRRLLPHKSTRHVFPPVHCFSVPLPRLLIPA